MVKLVFLLRFWFTANDNTSNYNLAVKQVCLQNKTQIRISGKYISKCICVTVYQHLLFVTVVLFNSLSHVQTASGHLITSLIIFLSLGHIK